MSSGLGLESQAAWPPSGRALEGPWLPTGLRLSLCWESPEGGVWWLVKEVGYLRVHLHSPPKPVGLLHSDVDPSWDFVEGPKNWLDDLQ